MNDPSESLPEEIDCRSVKSMLDSKEEFFLLDCRRQEDYERVRLESSVLIPIEEIESRFDEIRPYKEQRIVIHCHSGGRSLMVTQWLRNQGFLKAQNMTGGIDAWATEIDTSLPRY